MLIYLSKQGQIEGKYACNIATGASTCIKQKLHQNDDFIRAFGSYVGPSNSKIQDALQVVEAIC